MNRDPLPGASAGAFPSGRGGLAWHGQAACRGEDPELFFSQDPAPGAGLKAHAAAERARAQKAGAICCGCPVSAECGLFAVTTGQRFGIWAGVNRERVRPVTPGPRLCRNGLHLMTPENSKPISGTGLVRCRECQRVSDARTGPARHARNAGRRNERDRERYAERKKAA